VAAVTVLNGVIAALLLLLCAYSSFAVYVGVRAWWSQHSPWTSLDYKILLTFAVSSVVSFTGLVLFVRSAGG
jgi:hypothetical protein